MSKELAPIKPDGTKQRNDVALTAAIGNTLVERILEGLPVYTDEGFIEVVVEGNTRRISSAQLNMWVSRQNVIPETGRALREVLDEARVERKRIARAERQNTIIENAEKRLHELTEVEVKPIETTRKYRIDRETGEPVLSSVQEVEGGARMTEALIKGLTFSLERLDSPRYGSKSETKNTHLVFSLSDLRRAKERRDELIGVE